MSKQKDMAAKALTAAMGVESGVAVPGRARSGSFAALIADLRVGEAPASKTVCLRADLSMAEVLAQVPEESERLRNSVTSAVTRAKAKNPGADYTIEAGQFTTKTSVCVTVVITRVA
jgi:hypothetical protein